MKHLVFLFILLSSIHSKSLEPKVQNASAYVKHTYFSLEYVESHEQSKWVFYKLTKPLVNGNTKRKINYFKKDTKIKTTSSSHSDYNNNGYDRGHLCPAGSMDMNTISLKETFITSNISPQKPGFNRGVWKRLENHVMILVNTYDSLYVVTCPIFKDIIGTIGDSEVTIPGYFYKVIYIPHERLIYGYFIPNRKTSNDVSSYKVSVDLIEDLTGIDFFYRLDDAMEDMLEQ